MPECDPDCGSEGKCGGAADGCGGSCEEECEAPAEFVNDDSVMDDYADTCTSWYDDNDSDCGASDTEYFKASEFCCACGGGERSGGGNEVCAGWDSPVWTL